MTEKQIRPIPKYMLRKIKAADDKARRDRKTLFYHYFTRFGGELAKVTVAVKTGKNKWCCKQVVVHGIHSETCFIKDIFYAYMGGYRVGWFNEGLSRYEKWYEGYGWDTAMDKYFEPFGEILNAEFILTLPAYRYSAVDRYRRTDIFRYLRLYEKYPQAEMLVKFGLDRYATSKQILSKVGKDKGFRSWLIRNRDALARDYHYVGTLLKAYRTGENPRKVQQMEADRKRFIASGDYRELKTMFGRNETERLFAYIWAQDTNLSSYNDYVKACLYLGLDMTLPKNRFPHDFGRWHDIRIDEYRTAKAMKDEEERKELYEKFALIAEKYLPMQQDTKDAFVVVIARSPADLIREGDVLHHCVGRMNYDQRFIREESLIFFIRNRETPDVPFVTVEYSLKNRKILQCYGDHDTKPDEAVLRFVHKKWLPYANKKLKTITAAA